MHIAWPIKSDPSLRLINLYAHFTSQEIKVFYTYFQYGVIQGCRWEYLFSDEFLINERNNKIRKNLCERLLE